MPFSLIKHPHGVYSVINTETGHLHAAHTTKEKAQAQMRLLNALHHGFIPTGKKSQKE